MALVDPNDPLAMQQALFPAPTDPYAGQWPPPEFGSIFTLPDAQQVIADYGLDVPPPPPPPPPPTQNLGPGLGSQPIVELAAPPLIDPAATGSPTQPGLGIPADMLAAPDGPDPWAGLTDTTPAITDEQQLGYALDRFGRGEDPTVDPRAPELPPEIYTEDEATDADTLLALRNPIAAADKRAQQDVARDQHMAGLLKQKVDADVAWQQKNEAVRVQARAEADAARKALDEESSKLAADGGFWDSRSTGEKALGLAAIFAGALAAGPNGQNQALAIWERSIDRHVANAQRKMADKRSGVAQMYQRLGDDFLANEAMRTAAWKGVVAQIDSEMQLYDPRGSTVRKRTEARMHAIGQIQASQDRAAAFIEERAMKRGKFELESQKAQVDIANGKLDAEKKRRSMMGGGPAPKKSPEQWKAEGYTVVPPVPMSEKEYDTWLGRRGKGDALGEEGRKAEAKRVDDVRKFGLRALKNKDGSTPLAGDEETRREVETALDSSEQIVDIIDEVLAIRDRVGGESSWGNSDDYQRLKVLENNLVLLKKSGTQGMSSDSDMQRIQDALGADNVASFRSRAAGLEKARERTLGALNSKVRKKTQYDGPSIEIANRWGDAKKTVADGEYKMMLEDGEKRSVEEYRQAFGGFPGDGTDMRALHERMAQTGNLFPDQFKVLQALRAQVSGADEKKRDAALERLREFATSSKDRNVRFNAQSVLDTLVGANPPALGDAPSPYPTGRGVKDTVAQ